MRNHVRKVFRLCSSLLRKRDGRCYDEWMSTELSQQDKVEVVGNQGSPDDLLHLICWCDPDLAYCGTDVTDSPMKDDPELGECAVCFDLDKLPYCATAGSYEAMTPLCFLE